jgi:hypothetical protein
LRGSDAEFTIVEDRSQEIRERGAVGLRELYLTLGYARVEARLRDARDPISLLRIEVRDARG